MKRKKYKSRGRVKNKRISTYDIKPKPSHIFMILLFLGAIIFLYYITPDCIEIKTSIDDFKADEIRTIVREILEEEKAKQAQELGTDVVTPVTEEEVTKAVEEKKTEITSRSGGQRTEPTKTTYTTDLGTYRLTHYYPRR